MFLEYLQSGKCRITNKKFGRSLCNWAAIEAIDSEMTFEIGARFNDAARYIWLADPIVFVWPAEMIILVQPGWLYFSPADYILLVELIVFVRPAETQDQADLPPAFKAAKSDETHLSSFLDG